MVRVWPAVRRPPAINVTPLIDVVLVLLIVCMVLTPFSRRQLEVQLAGDTATAGASGPLRRVRVTLRAPDGLAIDGRPVTRDDYLEQLRALLRERPARDRVVLLTAARDVPYGRVVEAIDRAKRAGASVGLGTRDVGQGDR